ncbi:MAG: leucine-rich repeat domain-containing protein [Bacteroidales bacterium]|nr:leucine-rich repeat domain-containing protein [Bacteroidales bacterium]
MKKLLLAFFMAIVMALPAMAEEEDPGWSFNEETGELRVWGDFEGSYPWDKIKESIKSVVFEEGVARIGQSALYSCENLTSISISSTVEHIELRAFHDNRNVKSIVVDSNNTKYDSRNNCNAIINTETGELIRGCVNTVIPFGVKKIGVNAMSMINGLTEFYLPSSVEEIDDYAYVHNDFQSVSIPYGVRKIGSCVFHFSKSLTDIEFANSVEEIGGYTFSYCTSLKSVKLPEGLSVIDYCMFGDCTSLEYLEIPKSVTRINSYAFYTPVGTSYNLPCGVKVLKVNSETPAEVFENTFYKLDLSNITLLVPEGSKAAYESADYWKDFGTIEETKLTPTALRESKSSSKSGSESKSKSKSKSLKTIEDGKVVIIKGDKKWDLTGREL